MRELTRGQRIGQRFTLLRRLGGGGMGEVWLAQDAELREHVALKFLAPALADQAGMLDLLRAECRNSRRLIHPHIVRVFDVHSVDDTHFLSMEYVGGGDLSRLRGGDPAAFLPAIVQVVAALDYAHDMDLVHRDVKLANILCMEDGTARLSDFGIAGIVHSAATGGGGVTPGTASPQQRQGDPADPADDVYALGAALHELISGDLPAADGISDNAFAALSLPDGLGELVHDMLAPEREARASLAEVETRLLKIIDPRDLRTVPPENLATAGEDVFETIAPISLRRDTQSPVQTSSAGQRKTVHTGVAVSIGLVLFLGVVLVFYVLPGSVAQRTVPTPVVDTAADEETATAAAASGVTSVSGLTPYQLAELTRAKRGADEALAGLLERQQRLQNMDVMSWAAVDFEGARAQATSGDVSYGALDYAEAGTAYTTASERMDALIARGETLRDESVAAGWDAFAAGDGDGAVERFSFALRIDADHGEAATGLARAQQLPAVQSHMIAGEQQEAAGSLSAALTEYRAALTLDPAYEAARKAEARVAAGIGSSRFRAAMSDGFAALGRGSYDAARSAFGRAAKMSPGSSEPKDALAQVEMQQRGVQIANNRASAQGHERAERWAEAVDDYAAVLALDPALVFAREGQERSAAMKLLHERVDRLIEQPARMASASVFREAQGLLEQGRAQTPGPSLDAKLIQLERQMSLARTPVPVVLQSDNQTEVSLQRVDRLGRFDSRELLLRPGTYTLVGTRDGYRDVRRQFTVVAGEAPPPVVVRCEERI